MDVAQVARIHARTRQELESRAEIGSFRAGGIFLAGGRVIAIAPQKYRALHVRELRLRSQVDRVTRRRDHVIEAMSLTRHLRSNLAVSNRRLCPPAIQVQVKI